MSERKKYLKPNVVIEPLFDSWYAWSHLISPATAAMNLTERHLSIIESYLAAPDIHAKAVLNPKMRGGPFMDFNGGRVADFLRHDRRAIHEDRTPARLGQRSG